MATKILSDGGGPSDAFRVCHTRFATSIYTWMITLLLLGYRVGKWGTTGHGNAALGNKVDFCGREAGFITKALRPMNFSLVPSAEAKPQDAGDSRHQRNAKRDDVQERRRWSFEFSLGLGSGSVLRYNEMSTELEDSVIYGITFQWLTRKEDLHVSAVTENLNGTEWTTRWR